MPVDIVTGHIKYKDSNGQYQEIAGLKGESGGISDVQVNGVSVVNQGVANVPLADANTFGVIKTKNNYGTLSIDGFISVNPASVRDIKDQANWRQPISGSNAGDAAFYGLARAAGDTTQAAVWDITDRNYTETAKSKISDMLSAPVTVSGTTPSITAMAGVRYICGECATLDITVPASGIVDVVFESGSTPTVLTVTPPTGMTIKWANGFDPTSLQSNAKYEIRITDGELGEAVVYGTGGSNENAYTLIVDETFAEDTVSNTWDLPNTYNEFVINLLVLGTAQNTTETTGQAILRFKNGTCPSGLIYLIADLTSLVRKASYTEYTFFIKRDLQTGITEFHSCPFARSYIQTNLCMVGEPTAIHLTTNDLSRYIGAGTKLKIYAR